MTTPRRRWSFNLRTLFVVVTVGAALFSWLLLELWRLPYRPPVDMTTFLGTERDAIPLLIGCIAALWVAFVAWCYATHQATVRGVSVFVLLLGILLGVVVPIIKNPPWPIASEDSPATQIGRP